jgi:antitoxin component of MazEF toxin-antitoxin module
VRAILRLEKLADASAMRIPAAVAQALQVESNADAQLAVLKVLTTRAEMMYPRRSKWDWRDRIFSADIDELLAVTALDEDFPAVAEEAARTIGRIRSLHAVSYLSAQQRKGNRKALRALAFIRDEAPSLPSIVSSQARLYAWLDNTWLRLTADPMGVVWRFLFGFLGGFLALAAYAWINLSGPAILINEKLGRTISAGITFGVFIGIVVVLAGEVPARLRGFWPLWMRLIASIVLGTLAGAVVWTVYAWLLLYNALPDLDTGTLMLGGLALALGFALAGTFRLAGWLGLLLTTGILLFVIWFETTLNLASPFIYFRSNEFGVVISQGLLIALLIALGGYAQALGRGLRRLLPQAKQA